MEKLSVPAVREGAGAGKEHRPVEGDVPRVLAVNQHTGCHAEVGVSAGTGATCPQGHALHWTGNGDGRWWCQVCGVYFGGPPCAACGSTSKDSRGVCAAERSVPPQPPTRHTHQVVFGRLVPGCPRCDELAAGAKPRTWGGRLYDPKVERARRQAAATQHEAYCYCPDTSPAALRCPTCGKAPYTD